MICFQTQAATTTTSMSAVDGMIGVSNEMGGKVFDPLGLAELHSINPDVNPHPKVKRGLVVRIIWYIFENDKNAILQL